MNYNYIFAQAYGEGSYNQSTYNGEQTTETSTSTASGSEATTSGTLANTGMYIALIVAIACALIFLALIIRFVRRKPSEKVEPTRTDDNSTPQ